MNYQETLLWLYSQLPMYQRIGGAAYKDTLDNTITLCNLLGNPQNYFESIHIAGTNGKGSVSHMLASILQEQGYKTGLYTSPHLKDFRERIRVNGHLIPKRKVTAFIKKYREAFEQIQPSFFEMTVGLAFDYFREEEVDIAIVEVGMGGRLDSTNIITPLVSVITNISLDHMQFLGDTPEKIAIEKAGIIKPGVPVVIGETQPETEALFRKKAQDAGSFILFADQGTGYRMSKRSGDPETSGPDAGYQLPLQGSYQKKNLKTVLAVVEVLRHLRKPYVDPASGNLHPVSLITDQALRSGLNNVIVNTGLQGRWQILSERPLTICDTGHNEAGIREVVHQLAETPHNNLHIVFGQVDDKETESILALLPKEAAYYFCKANIPRGRDAFNLKHRAEEAGLKGSAYESVQKALAAARESARSDDLIFIGGSTFVVAEVLT
ncbi:MAG: bifunctional folylpolyglutamate synthase/dihydrofolate synthase [Bacteroidales bacterium]|nr:bifunctional folylpolyglutamate synthase/dihydrofolate synthase [Bacteroidales bacterium]